MTRKMPHTQTPNHSREATFTSTVPTGPDSLRSSGLFSLVLKTSYVVTPSVLLILLSYTPHSSLSLDLVLLNTFLTQYVSYRPPFRPSSVTTHSPRQTSTRRVTPTRHLRVKYVDTRGLQTSPRHRNWVTLEQSSCLRTRGTPGGLTGRRRLVLGSNSPDVSLYPSTHPSSVSTVGSTPSIVRHLPPPCRYRQRTV